MDYITVTDDWKELDTHVAPHREGTGETIFDYFQIVERTREVELDGNTTTSALPQSVD